MTEYTALQIKHAVIGQGKDQFDHMACRLLQLPGEPSADGADALACTIGHAHDRQGLGAIATRGFRVKNGRLV